MGPRTLRATSYPPMKSKSVEPKVNALLDLHKNYNEFARMTTERVLNVTRHLTHASYFGLLAVLIVNTMVQGAPWVFYLWPVPLMIFIPGLLRDSTRTLIWMCFVVLLYFYMAIDNLAGSRAHPLDHAELVLTAILFSSAMIWARCKQKLGL